jgi:hypothetical protein
MVSIDQIMKYENGEMERGGEEEIAMFQEMINDGSAWQLQGSYGRVAMALIETGLCTRPQLGKEVFRG